jgi:hypothetical protein
MMMTIELDEGREKSTGVAASAIKSQLWPAASIAAACGLHLQNAVKRYCFVNVNACKDLNWYKSQKHRTLNKYDCYFIR